MGSILRAKEGTGGLTRSSNDQDHHAKRRRPAASDARTTNFLFGFRPIPYAGSFGEPEHSSNSSRLTGTFPTFFPLGIKIREKWEVRDQTLRHVSRTLLIYICPVLFSGRTRISKCYKVTINHSRHATIPDSSRGVRTRMYTLTANAMNQGRYLPVIGLCHRLETRS